MRGHRSITLLSPIALCAVLIPAALTAGPAVMRAQANGQESAQELVREVVRNELNGQTGKPTYWRYREIDTVNGARTLFEVYQTQAGTVKRLLAVNGVLPSPAERRQQDTQLEKILNNPALARKAAAASRQDGEKERKLLAMLPNAFLFQYDGEVDDLVRLTFQPNPRFHPPTREAKVFHHMEGHLFVDPRQKRLAEIDGRLMTEVKFLWGLLGYLNKGGTFLVRQTDLGGANWKMTRLRVNMGGKALFFATVGVQEDERFEDYREIPSDTTLRQAVNQLER
jgi:hypothetical protein